MHDPIEVLPIGACIDRGYGSTVVAASIHKSLRAIALFEGAKGAVVLIAGAGLLQWAHHHARHAVDDVVRHLHLNPGRSHPRVFEQLATHVTDTELKWLAFG